MVEDHKENAGKENAGKEKTATIQKIVDMLNEGQSVKEVMANAQVSSAYVYRIKNRYDKDILPMEEDEQTDWDSFVETIKITPDKKVLTDNNEGKEGSDVEEYQCGACGHVFNGGTKTFQSFCPACGAEFN